MIVGCGDLTILLVGLGFHCFLLKCKEKLRHSLGRPSRSDFVQFEVVEVNFMGLFGKSKKEREKEYMSRIDVPSCLKENFTLTVDEIFTIIGVGTVVTGNVETGICRTGDKAYINKANGEILETAITSIDVHTKERRPNGSGYKTEHIGIGLRGIYKEQLDKGDKIMVKNANMYGM